MPSCSGCTLAWPAMRKTIVECNTTTTTTTTTTNNNNAVSTHYARCVVLLTPVLYTIPDQQRPPMHNARRRWRPTVQMNRNLMHKILLKPLPIVGMLGTHWWMRYEIVPSTATDHVRIIFSLKHLTRHVMPSPYPSISNVLYKQRNNITNYLCKINNNNNNNNNSELCNSHMFHYRSSNSQNWRQHCNMQKAMIQNKNKNKNN